MAHDTETVRTETISVTFEPELAARFWQHNALRLLRANEHILHGLMNAATREIELAQELTRYNLEKFYKFSNGAGPEKLPAQEEDRFKEFERIVAGLREVSQYLWKTFGEASRLLLEGSLTQAKETFVEPVTDAVTEAVKEAQAVAGHISDAIQE